MDDKSLLSGQKCNEEILGGYEFYSIGDQSSRFDSYIDEYVIVPSCCGPIDFKISQHIPMNYIGAYTYHWKRYYSHGLHSQRYQVQLFFEKYDVKKINVD